LTACLTCLKTVSLEGKHISWVAMPFSLRYPRHCGAEKRLRVTMNLHVQFNRDWVPLSMSIHANKFVFKKKKKLCVWFGVLISFCFSIPFFSCSLFFSFFFVLLFILVF
jgi:hypothetical protein